MAHIINREPPAERKAKARLVWRIQNAGPGEGEIDLFDAIGEDWFGDGTSAKSFNQELRDLGNVSTIRLNINSPGGIVDDALAMYDALLSHPAHVTAHIVTAQSAATIVAMAADDREITPNGKFMIHDAMAFVDVFGYLNVSDIADAEVALSALKAAINEESDNIASIYAARAGGNTTAWRERMTINGKLGTTYRGQEAVDIGLAHSVSGAAVEDSVRARIAALALPADEPAALDLAALLEGARIAEHVGYKPPIPALEGLLTKHPVKFAGTAR